MTVKDVYSIRITKNDEEIKNYLEQFPSSKQNKALKSLLKYGVGRLQEDYAQDQYINLLREEIRCIQELQEKKLEEIKGMIKELQELNLRTPSAPIQTTTKDGDGDNDNSFDLEKAKKSMEEALSMFVG